MAHSSSEAPSEASAVQCAPIPVISTAAFDADPHGVIRKYRSQTPLLQREDGSYVVIGARDAEMLITDPRTRQLETELIRARGVKSGALFEFFDNTMLLSNGPLHRRRRSPMSRAFAFRVVEEIRPRIRAIANELLDGVFTQGQMNFLDQYAAQIPARLISEIIGISAQDIPRFTAWVYQLTRALSVSFRNDDIPEIESATMQLRDYVADLIADRRANPRQDFLSLFVMETDEHGALSPTEAVVQVMSIIVGGSDTTRAAITMMVGLLLTHRDQWNEVVRNADLIQGAVLESLRYDAVIASIPRVSVTDIAISGHTVPANRILSLSTLAMLRDPDVYSEPERFDIHRTDHPRRHPIFGGGVHRCLGELLARAEMEEALAVLVNRLPSLQLVGNAPTLHGHSGLRRIDGMQVAW